jgi:acetyl esterase/lipase
MKNHRGFFGVDYHGGGFAINYSTKHLRNCARYANEASYTCLWMLMK